MNKISLRCSTCGELISVTDREFGMDCRNGCGKKAYYGGGEMVDIEVSIKETEKGIRNDRN